MTEKRVYNIVEYLVRHLLHQGVPLTDEEQIIQLLVAQGYQLNEIEEAFAWIFREQDIINPESFRKHLYQGIRVFSPVETEKLSLRFREELLRLLVQGLISQAEMEEIILAGLKQPRPEIDLKELVVLVKEVISEPDRLALILTQAGGESPQVLH